MREHAKLSATPSESADELTSPSTSPVAVADNLHVSVNAALGRSDQVVLISTVVVDWAPADENLSLQVADGLQPKLWTRSSSRSCSTRHMILPEADLGSWSTNSMLRGTL